MLPRRLGPVPPGKPPAHHRLPTSLRPLARPECEAHSACKFRQVQSHTTECDDLLSVGCQHWSWEDVPDALPAKSPVNTRLDVVRAHCSSVLYAMRDRASTSSQPTPIHLKSPSPFVCQCCSKITTTLSGRNSNSNSNTRQSITTLYSFKPP